MDAVGTVVIVADVDGTAAAVALPADDGYELGWNVDVQVH